MIIIIEKKEKNKTTIEQGRRANSPSGREEVGRFSGQRVREDE